MENSSQSAAMSAADREKEPSEVPTSLTSGGRYCIATSYVTWRKGEGCGLRGWLARTI